MTARTIWREFSAATHGRPLVRAGNQHWRLGKGRAGRRKGRMNDGRATPMDDGTRDPRRREFLRNAAVAAGLVSLPRIAAGNEPVGDADAATAPGYLSFSPGEASFTEALVNILCPADRLTPSGTECGLTIFIDRQLAGAFGRGERLYLRGPWRPGAPEHGYQLLMTPEQFYKAGVATAEQECRARHGVSFESLAAEEADGFLTAVAEGKFSRKPPLAEWFNELVYPLFLQACFADPIYGGNREKVFWKMLGYPGLPAVNGINMVKYRGRPFPLPGGPRSMEDFG